MSDKVEEPGTIPSTTLARLMKADPELYNLLMKNRAAEKLRQKEAKDLQQDTEMILLTARVSELEAKMSKHQTFVTYIKGVIATLTVLWTILTFVVPYVLPKDAAKAAICQKIESCRKPAKK